MFWRFGGYASVSTLDSILDKPDVTVEELLDESDLIQELKQQNSKLIEFLRDEPVLEKLLGFVVSESSSGPEGDGGGEAKEQGKAEEEKEKPSGGGGGGISFFGRGPSRSRSKSQSKKDGDGDSEQETREAQRKKHAYVACEVLSSEVWSITEALLEHQAHLRQFWRYMHKPAPLDPLQAGYFTKVNEALLDKKTEEMLSFIKQQEGLVPAMLQHVDCPMVMDLLLKIISLEKHEEGAGIVDWLQTQDLIPLLLAYLSPKHNPATQTSAGDFLKAIITISANATTQDQSVIGPNELTRQLVSEKSIKTLIDDMLRGGNPLTVGVGIIIEVIRKNNSDYDLENQAGPEPKTSDPIYLGTLLRQFANNVPSFMDLIRSKSASKPSLQAAYGGKIEPLGFDRFKTCELMAELLHCSNMGLLNERGAEDEVSKKDAEREALKAAGKLSTPKAPVSPTRDISYDEFGSSVDSHGFHHAERPSDYEMGEKTEGVRRLEVQNASDEDEFEKVTAPAADDLPDVVSFDDLNEKAEQTDLPALEKIDKRDQAKSLSLSPTNADVPKPLSPTKQTKPALPQFNPPPTQAAQSPTTAGVTDQIDNLDVDEDTVMTEFGEEPADRIHDISTELEKELGKHPEDKPAPLFARKDASKSASSGDSSTTQISPGVTEFEEGDQSVATLQGDTPTLNGERSAYDTEVDGSPVVGDLLKIQFVEHQVVPTILDFFFRFPWNNFLHNVVYDVVQQVFNGTLDRGYNRTLAFNLFSQVQTREGMSGSDLGLVSLKDITDRILDGQRASDVSQSERGMRLGYMGHLTLIAEEVCKFGNRHPPESLDQHILDRVNREEWMQYVDGVLAETRDKDNAVLGGVRPQESMGARPMGMGGQGLQGGFSSNTASTLASAGITPQDSLAMSEGTVGQSFEMNSGNMLSGFNDRDEDEEMEDEGTANEPDRTGGPFSDDEQTAPSQPMSSRGEAPSAPPPPLNLAPSRARLQLAARLAQKKKEAESDPDAADADALEAAGQLPEEPSEGDIDLGPATDQALAQSGSGLHVTGLRTVAGMGRFAGLVADNERDSDSSSDGGAEYGSFDEDDAGRDLTVDREQGDYEQPDNHHHPGRGRGDRVRRRPSTTEAKQRGPLDDDDDEDEVAPLQVQPVGEEVVMPEEASSSSDEDDLVEIRTRRTSGSS